MDAIIEGNPAAVAIVFSNHGPRAYLDQSDLAGSDLHAVFANLVAARTPGRNGLYPANVTTVNLLSILFNAYLDTILPTAPNRTFASGASSPFELREFPNPDDRP